MLLMRDWVLKLILKKYFELDVLKTYLKTDICVDPFFSSILYECGCEGLIKLNQKLQLDYETEEHYSEKLKEVLVLDDV